jgi:hypothetical protein
MSLNGFASNSVAFGFRAGGRTVDNNERDGPAIGPSQTGVRQVKFRHILP